MGISLHYMAVTRYNVRFYAMRYAGLRYTTLKNSIDDQTPVNFASTLVPSSEVNSPDILYIFSSKATGSSFDI